MCLQKVRIAVFCIGLVFFFSCRPSHVLLSPYPDRIETIEGFASLKLIGAEGYSRSRFSFFFSIPDKGKIEAFDLLGRTIYQIIIDKERAFLVVPSKKVYWESTEERIIDTFIGARLAMSEVICFLIGKWDYLREKGKDKSQDLWDIKKDNEGRVVEGRKQGMSFTVSGYIEGTGMIRSLDFKNRFQKGTLKVLGIDFNSPAKKSHFSMSFIKDFEEKSWEEIQKIINHEN